jgi:Pycsar effector protein
MSQIVPDSAVEFIRGVYGDALEWYKLAETKAQVILAIDTIFVSLLFGVVVSERVDLQATVSQFGYETWIFLTLTVCSLLLSIICVVACLISRFSAREQRRAFRRLGVLADELDTYGPEVMWFFGLVSALDRELFAARIQTVDASFQVRALAHQAHLLSRNVTRKHRWVNRGFLLVMMALISLLSTGISLIIRAS